VYYENDKSDLSWEAEHAIDSVIKRMNNLKSVYYFEIDGYADSTGAKGHNQQLAQKKAELIRKVLTDSGFTRENILCRGHGDFSTTKNSRPAKTGKAK
jgi:outer membrane protein OmpA-like peptidoglycan-associated protein